MNLSAARRIARQTGLAVREARVAGSEHGYQHLMLALSRRAARVRQGGRGAGGGPGGACRRVRGRGQQPALAGRGGRRPGARGAGRHRDRAGHLDDPGRVRVPVGRLQVRHRTRPDVTPPGGIWRPVAGFIASLPLDNTPGESAWPQWYARRRLLPYLRTAVDSGALRPEDGRLIEAVMDRIDSLLASPAEPPSRIHGDCWAGNVLWSGDRGWLIDPAAHGGHRETDLAMLDLFGAPTWTASWPATTTRRRWRRAGGPGSRCIRCTRCWCTPACSAPPIARAFFPRLVRPCLCRVLRRPPGANPHNWSPLGRLIRKFSRGHLGEDGTIVSGSSCSLPGAPGLLRCSRDH